MGGRSNVEPGGWVRRLMYESSGSTLVQVTRDHCDLKTVATSLPPYLTGRLSICFSPVMVTPVLSWFSFYFTDVSSSVSRTLPSSGLKQSLGLKYQSSLCPFQTCAFTCQYAISIWCPVGITGVPRPKLTFIDVKVASCLSLCSVGISPITNLDVTKHLHISLLYFKLFKHFFNT